MHDSTIYQHLQNDHYHFNKTYGKRWRTTSFLPLVGISLPNIKTFWKMICSGGGGRSLPVHSLRNHSKSINTARNITVFAFIIIAAFFVYVFVCSPIGVGIVDESFYFTMVKRFADGDRVFADEWKVNQLFTVLLILPYKLYVHIVGSTEGLVLFMRYLYISSELILSVYLYKKLEKYGAIALIYVLMLFTISPLLNFSYYNITTNCIALILVSLFSEKPSPTRKLLIALGIIASCAVIANPILALGYFAYTIQIFLQRRRKEFFKRYLHTWKYITIGILLSLLVFAFYVAYSHHFSFTALIQNLPYLLSDPDYSFFGHFVGLLYKGYLTICYFGYLNSIIGIGLGVAAMIWRRKRVQKIRTILFVSSCGIFFLSYLHLAYIMIFSPHSSYKQYLYNLPISGFSAPIILFALICILLSNKPRPMCFAFWQTSFFVSILVDFSSLICFSYAGIIALFPMLVCCHDMITDLRDEWSRLGKSRKKGKRENRFLQICLGGKPIVILLSFFVSFPVLFWGCELTVVRTLVPMTERFYEAHSMWRPMNQTIEQGPLKGIRTNNRVKTQYNKMMSDMDLIEKQGDGPLYVHYISALPYIAVDLPIGNYSAYIDDEFRLNRSKQYWDLHPDKIPTVIYFPLYDSTSFYPREDETYIQTEMAKIKELFDFEVKEGEAGVILMVNAYLGNEKTAGTLSKSTGS